MNKIAQAFQDKKAFIAYLMAGDPSLEKTAEYILALQEAGTDLIEIGIPFSDPIAEGEVIQQAGARALSAGATLEKVFEMAESIRDRVSVPTVFMTCLNPVFFYGYDRFFARCRDCGVAGIIVPDLPFEEQHELRDIAAGCGIESIMLIAPTSEERIAKIAQAAGGFIYLVSSLGVTGVRSRITTDISAMVAEIRRHTQAPVAVGFGISTPQQAVRLSQAADGIIVGSAIVRIIAEYGENAAAPLQAYVCSMKTAMTGAVISPASD